VAALIAVFALLAALLLAIRFVLSQRRGSAAHWSTCSPASWPAPVDAIDTGWAAGTRSLLRGFRVFDRPRCGVAAARAAGRRPRRLVDVAARAVAAPAGAGHRTATAAIRRDRGGLLHLGGLGSTRRPTAGIGAHRILAQRGSSFATPVAWATCARAAARPFVRVELRPENLFGRRYRPRPDVPGSTMRTRSLGEWLPFPVASTAAKGAYCGCGSPTAAEIVATS
jgi:hypothetical protein